MNERIRELAEQANYLATEKEFPYDEDWFYLYNKKFAELIVKECVAELESVKVNEYRTDVYDIGYDDGLTQAVETIKEHFGVEE